MTRKPLRTVADQAAAPVAIRVTGSGSLWFTHGVVGAFRYTLSVAFRYASCRRVSTSLALLSTSVLHVQLLDKVVLLFVTSRER